MLTTTTAAEADAQARSVADEWRAGERTMTEALWRCVELATAAGVVADVAAEKIRPNYGVQVAEDVAPHLEDLLISKIVKQVGAPSNLSLDRIADGASLLGWARGLLRSAVPSEMRRYRRHFVNPVDVTVENAGAPVVVGDVPNPTRTDDEASRSADEVFRMRTWGLRSGQMPHERSRALTRHLGIPTPGRVPAKERAAVLKLITEHRYVAARSAKRAAEATALREDTDVLLSSVWAGYKPEHLELIASSDPMVASAIVESAAAPRFAMSTEVTRRLQTWCVGQRTEAGEIDDASWQRTVRRLVRTFRDFECDLHVRYEPRAYIPKTERDTRSDVAKFHAAVEAVLGIGEHTLGRTGSEILGTLRTVRDRLETMVAIEHEDDRLFDERA